MKAETIKVLWETIQGKTNNVEGFIEDVNNEVEIFEERRRFSNEIDYLEQKRRQREILESVSNDVERLAKDVTELSPYLCEFVFRDLWDWRKELEDLTADKMDEYHAIPSSESRVATLIVRDKLVDAMRGVSKRALQLKAQLAPHQQKVISDRDYLLLYLAKIYHHHTHLEPAVWKKKASESPYYTVVKAVLVDLGEEQITDRQIRNIIKKYWKSPPLKS